MSLSDKNRRIAFSIISHLQTQLDSNLLSGDSAEGVSVALQCLCEAYGLELGNEGQAQRYGVKPTLEELFAGLHTVSEEDKKEADTLKQRGNAQLKQNKFDEAISCYTQAIDVDSSNATFFCNRAAAYIKQEAYEKALVDCKEAISLDPLYARAHGRLGYIFSSLNRLQESKDSFEKAIELDPGNESYKGNLDAVNDQLKSGVATGGEGGAARAGGPMPSGGGPMPSGGGAPDLSGLLGGGGLSSFLQNPGFMNMASSMMNNPAFQNMASRMMQQGGPSPGNMGEMMPDIVRTARDMQQNDPELFESLRQQATQFAPQQQDETNSQNMPEDPSKGEN